MKTLLPITFGVILLCQSVFSRLGYFWHVTDFHLDQNYTVDGDPSRMCWSYSRSARAEDSSNEFGNYECDAPITLINSSIYAMKEILPEPDFIIWTGDDTAHVDDSFFSVEKVVEVISEITDLLMEAFPDTLVIPVLGNHDLYPKNQIPVGSSELQTQVADLWKKWLDPFDAYLDFKNDGRYVANIPDSNATFLALNTLLWYKNNNYTANDPEASDPGGQFSWADEAIKTNAENGKYSYLMGHIPPGSFERYFDDQFGFHWYQERYNLKYIELINENFESIAAQFFGHHHTDSFRVFLRNDTSPADPISYLLISPAVSPMRSTLTETTGANNPGIRLVSYDTQTAEIMEVSQYYLNLTNANDEGEATWNLEYNLTDILSLGEISPAALYDATLRMKEDSQLFDEFYPVNTVQWEDASACSSQCHSVFLCSITEIDYLDYYECNNDFRKEFINSNLLK